MSSADCRSANRARGSTNKNPHAVSSTRVEEILLTQTKTLNRVEVRITIRTSEVAEQAVALADHHHEAAAVVHVLLVLTQVRRDLLDARSQQSDLDFRATGVAFAASELFDNLGCFFTGQWHGSFLPSRSRMHGTFRTALAAKPVGAPTLAGLKIIDLWNPRTQFFGLCESWIRILRSLFLSQNRSILQVGDDSKNQATRFRDNRFSMNRSQPTILTELLVLQAQSGSRRAMNQLVELWTPKLARRAYRLTQDHEGVQEVIQESWIGIARGIARLRDPSRFGAWSLRIVHNQSADWIRKRARDRRNTLQQMENGSKSEATDHPSTEETELIRIAVSTLDPKLREVVYLFYMDQCTIEQIAIVLNIPQGTAKTRLARARSILKSQLERSTQ